MAILNPLERAAVASLRLAPSRRQTIALEMPPTPATYGSINGSLPTTDHTPMTRPQRGARYITADGRPLEPERQYQYVQSATDDGYFDIEIEAGGDYYAMELIPTSYKWLIWMYSLVPISSMIFITAAIALLNIWPAPKTNPTGTYHAREFLVGAATWVVSYTLKVPSFYFATCFGRYVNLGTTALSTILAVLLEESLRLFSLALLGMTLERSGDHLPWPSTREDAFRRVWWFALGWAVGVEVYSIAQGYGQLVLYKELLQDECESGASTPDTSDAGDARAGGEHGRIYVSAMLKATSPPERYPGDLSSSSLLLGRHSDTTNSSGRKPQLHLDAVGSYIDEEMAHLIAVKSRTELELVYGCPPPNIPVFISCLQRLDSLLLTLGLTLILSSSFLSALSLSPLPSPDTPYPPPIANMSGVVNATLPTFLLLVAVHTAVALMWGEALPRIGVHTASYAALLVALGLFFAGLASWGALK